MQVGHQVFWQNPRHWGPRCPGQGEEMLRDEGAQGMGLPPRKGGTLYQASLVYLRLCSPLASGKSPHRADEGSGVLVMISLCICKWPRHPLIQ